MKIFYYVHILLLIKLKQYDLRGVGQSEGYVTILTEGYGVRRGHWINSRLKGIANSPWLLKAELPVREDSNCFKGICYTNGYVILSSYH